MIEVQLPDGRVIEVDTTDPQAAAAAAKAYMQRRRAPQSQPQRGGAEDDLAAARRGLGQQQSGVEGAVSAGAQGFNLGLADILGAPVDLVNNAPRLFGGGKMAEKPFLGSDQLRGGMRAVGATNVDDVSEISPEYRPFARMGQVVGQSVPFAAAPFLAPARAAAVAPAEGFIGNMVRSAQTNPTGFMAKEAATTLGSAQGAAVAEYVAPNDPLAGVIGEVAGAIVSPTSLVAGAIGKTGEAARRAVSSVSPAGRQRAAAEQLGKLLKETGEDPQAILKALDSADEFGFSLAERSNSPTLLGLRQIAIKENPDLARRALEGDAQAVGRLSARMREIVNPGDARALTSAADTELARRGAGIEAASADTVRQYDTDVAGATKAANDLIDDALRQSKEASGVIAAGDASARAGASVRARSALDNAYEKARQVERALWESVPGDAPIRPDKFLETVKGLSKERRLAMQGIAPEVTGEINRYRALMGKLETPTAREILALRSELLDYSRSAYANPAQGRKVGSIYSDLAGSLLDDIGALPGTADARAFSRAFHDRFSRTFAGDVLRTRASGAEAISETQTLERAMVGNPAQRGQRLNELQQATTGVPFRSGGSKGRSAGFGPEMTQAQGDFLRTEFAKMVDPSTGRLDPLKAQRFLRDNGPLVNHFPEVREEVLRAVGAEKNYGVTSASVTEGLSRQQAALKAGLKAEQGVQGAAARDLQKQAFARVANAGEVPERAIAAILSGARPADDFTKLAAFANKAGPDAVAGLRASVFDHLRQVSTKGDQLSFKALTEALATPLGRGGKDLLSAMRVGGVITTTQSARLRQALSRGLQHEGTNAIARAPAKVVDDVSDMFDFLVRIAGANYGSSVSILGSHSGAGLVAASAGSKLARKIADKIPAQRVKDILFKSMEDEELLRALLTRLDTRSGPRVSSAINAALLGTASTAPERLSQ